MSEWFHLAMDRAMPAGPFPTRERAQRHALGVTFALDESSTRRMDQDGHLIVELNHLTKANVCPYRGGEIPEWEQLGLDPARVYQLYRDPEELEKGAATFNGKPLLSQHMPVTSETFPEELVIGATGTSAVWNDPYVDNALSVWKADDIQDIMDKKRHELSSAYRYDADMTPGVTPDGVKFDGVMRNIRCNHVALVKTGRAGDDVIVGDAALENFEMSEKNKIALSLTGAVAMGALLVHLRPKLAQDAKLVDLTPAFKGVTRVNFKKSTGTIAARTKKLLTGVKLATDADLADVVQLLDKLEGGGGLPVPEAKDDAAMMDGDDDALSLDDEGGGGLMAKIAEYLKEAGVADDVIAGLDALSGTATDTPPATPGTPRVGGEKTDTSKDMVAKPAMDAAIKIAKDAAIKETTAQLRAVREAERLVQPLVGEIDSMAFDSAEEVYRYALKQKGVDADGITDAKALKLLVGQVQVPRTATPALGQDAALATAEGAKSFNELFPMASRR